MKKETKCDKESSSGDNKGVEKNSEAKRTKAQSTNTQTETVTPTVNAEEHRRRFEKAAEHTSRKYAEAFKKLAEYDKE